ncbi:putative ribonuclease H-like domain-containing protein, partial [Tanacetum coccineum]
NEPKKISEALEDESWVDAMQEELLQFKIQKVWVLVDLPYGKKAIGTKLVAQGHKQEEGIDYDEVFAPVARIKAIRIFLAFPSYMGFIVYQMDVKSAFLYGKIDEEVYVSQPPGFLDPKYPQKVYKVVKALYGLHQDPKAWYATLSTFLLKNGYRRGTIDKTLFLKKDKHDIILVQVYVDDIIFSKSFSKKHRVHKESVSKQGRKVAKGESSVQRDPLFDTIPEDSVDHMETENAQDEGRTREMVDEDKEIDEIRLSTEDVVSTDKEVVSTDKEKVSTDKEKVSTDRPIVSTDGSKISTDRQIEGTDEQIEGTEEHIEGTEEQVESTDGQRKGTEEHIEGTEEQIEGTEEHIEGTEEQVESTDGQRKGTEDHTEEEIAAQATQTPTQTHTSTVFGDDETIAKVLLNMSQAKAVSREKEKGVELKDIEEADRPRPTSTRSLLTLKPLPKIDPKDKGKKKIEEEDESESESDGIPQAEKKFKQLESDEELARKIQEEWEGEEERKRIAEEKAANEALIRNFDDIKARIEADRLLAEKLQEQEREQFTIEERAKFLHDTIAAQRKFLAQQRSEAIRNKPPTKNQLRNQMMTYLKHVGNFKHAELKIKKFEEVQALYEKIKRSDEDFISIGSAEDERLIKRMNEKGVDLSKSEVIKEESKEEVQEESKEEESTRKRKLGTRKKMKSRKRRYIQNTSEDDSDKENDELRLHLTIAPDEEKEVDYEILDRKYPIKEWKTECLGTKP